MPVWAISLLTTVAPSLISGVMTIIEKVIDNIDGNHPAQAPLTVAKAALTNAAMSISTAAQTANQ